MTRIGLLSDTHGYFNPKLEKFFSDCDEIWHAGDIGSMEVIKAIEEIKPSRAVYGNIDGTEIRKSFPKTQRFKCESVDVWMTHIGGYPHHYDSNVRDAIRKNPPGLFISGHSHILKVIYDKSLDLLHINPGAAGKIGPHKVMTAVRFSVDGKKIKDLEILELGERGGIINDR